MIAWSLIFSEGELRKLQPPWLIHQRLSQLHDTQTMNPANPNQSMVCQKQAKAEALVFCIVYFTGSCASYLSSVLQFL
jgi:hypothetical protein